MITIIIPKWVVVAGILGFVFNIIVILYMAKKKGAKGDCA